MSEVYGSAALGHLDVPPSALRFTEHEQIARAVAYVLGVIAFHPARPSLNGRPLIGHQLLGCLVETDHGTVSVVVFVVQVKHVLHTCHELSAHLGNAPLLVLPRLEFVFFKRLRMPSWEMESTTPNSTALPASNLNVQWSWPSGAGLQAMAIRWASPFSSSLGGLPGRCRSSRALWVTVWADELSSETILDGLASGDFYSSTGVDLAELESSQESISLRIEPQADFMYSTTFVGRDGKRLAETSGLEASYEPRGDEGYIRAVVKSSSGTRAWIQPMFLS